MTLKYTAAALADTVAALSVIFDIVRVVDPIEATEQPLHDLSSATQDAPGHNCFALWKNRRERCPNCISLHAVQAGERQTKYEFVDNDIFYEVAMPVEVDGKPLVLEIISKVNDRVLLNAYGINEFVSRVTAYNAQLHQDAGTGLYNKHYYDEKLYLLCKKAELNKTDVSVAIMEVDGFEHIASHFGHHVADEAIIAIGRLLSANVSRRRGDFVARIGTNTFAIVLDNIPRLQLRERLVDLTQRVTTLQLLGYEDLRVNVAMGVFQRSENPHATVPEITHIAAQRVEAARAAGFNRIAFSDR